MKSTAASDIAEILSAVGPPLWWSITRSTSFLVLSFSLLHCVVAIELGTTMQQRAYVSIHDRGDYNPHRLSWSPFSKVDVVRVLANQLYQKLRKYLTVPKDKVVAPKLCKFCEEYTAYSPIWAWGLNVIKGDYRLRESQDDHTSSFRFV